MQIILFDTESRAKLFPLTLTRAVADLRIGIFTIKEWWEQATSLPVYIYTDEYLAGLYETIPKTDSIFVDACVIPSPDLLERILSLTPGDTITDEQGLVAGRMVDTILPGFGQAMLSLFKNVNGIEIVIRLNSVCDLFRSNEDFIRQQFSLVTKEKTSLPIPAHVQFLNASDIFIEEGVELGFCILNASAGPIYIGKNAVIMDGSIVRGPFAMCEGAVLKMGSKMYGGTTLGPYCIGGGEIKNSILMGFTNKAHDGYLGDSVVGEWCNIGAGTSNSNIKNTATEVKVWDYYTHSYIMSGIKCGLIMGDYSRTAINTSINTGTVIGVCCNVFGEGLTPKVIPDFTWGTKGLSRYEFEKALQDIINWKRMKNKTLGETKVKVLKHIFEHYND